MRAICVALLTLAMSAPAASAWNLTSDAAPLPLIGPADAVSNVHGAVACALGDADLDGNADLVLRTVDAAGKAHLQALAGPHFLHAIWSHAISAKALLECAPDLGVDHVADPILRTAGEAVDAAGGASQQVQVALQTIDGATGAVAVTRSITEKATGATAAVGAVRDQALGTLRPAAAGALAEVTTQATTATALLPADLPLGGLGLQTASSATLRIIDSAGQVAGTVSLDQPGVDPLALVPLAAGGLPQVAALTSQAVADVQGAAAHVPTLSLYNPDGTLAWATDLAATTGVPMLLPAGDLDLDGVPDLLVETVTGSVSDVPAAAFTAVSGLDGRVLFETQAVAGSVVAIPLGTLEKGTALLQVAQDTADGAMHLSALDSAGSAVWSAEAAATAFPANLALDTFTGDLGGFTDLTGDGLPDVGVASLANSSLDLSVLDGATGKVAWATQLAGASQVMALASAADPHQATALAGHASQTLANVAGQASDLVAAGADGALKLSVIQGKDGQLEWSASAPLAEGVGILALQSAGDLDADGRADLLLTVGPVSAKAGADAGSATGALEGVQTYALSSATGATLFAASAAGTAANATSGLLAFVVAQGPAFVPVAAAPVHGAAEAAPGAGPLVLVAVLGLAVLTGRRRLA